MGLAEMQKTLARLYTDAAVRERFFGDPLKVGRELGLDDAEASLLARLSASEVKRFSESLHNKRLSGVAKLLPLTQRALRGRFNAHFMRYADENRSEGVGQHLDDALAFAEYLTAKLREERMGSGWTLDLLRFESARVSAANPTRRFVARLFRHDISLLVRSLARREEHPTVVRRRTVAVWWRPKARGPVRYSVFAAPRLFGRRRPQNRSRETAT